MVVTVVLGLGALCANVARADEAEECATKAEEGQSLRDQSRYIEAREDFARCARDTCPSVVRKDCNDWVASMDAKIPTVVFAARDTRGDDVTNVRGSIAGKTFALDGKAMPLDPGPIHVTFDAPGVGTAEVDVVIREGEKGRVVEIILGKSAAADPKVGTPAVEERRTPTAFVVTPWVFAGLSVASLATFGALQGVARGELSDLEAGCGATKTCAPGDLDPVQTKFTVSAVMFGASIATLATAVGLWVFAPKVAVKAPPTTSVRVELDVAPTGAGARVGGAF